MISHDEYLTMISSDKYERIMKGIKTFFNLYMLKASFLLSMQH